MAQHQEKRGLRGNLPSADCLHASIFDVLEPTVLQLLGVSLVLYVAHVGHAWQWLHYTLRMERRWREGTPTRSSRKDTSFWMFPDPALVFCGVHVFAAASI
jgi:hypothetical protein